MAWWMYDKQLFLLKRIARTEMATAQHRAVIASTEDDEDIIGYHWRLSGSHPEPDICDYYANIDRGLGKGVWTKEAVPRHKAHPHCMCTIVPRVMPVKEPGSTNYAEFIQNVTPERRGQLLPKWVRDAMASGAPLEQLIRPDGLGLVSKAEVQGGRLLPTAYEIAKAGGPHKGLLARYKNDPDHLLEKAIRGYQKRIAEHQSWIDNPNLHVEPDTDPTAIANYKTKKWPSDIRRLQAQADLLQGILDERKKS